MAYVHTIYRCPLCNHLETSSGECPDTFHEGQRRPLLEPFGVVDQDDFGQAQQRVEKFQTVARQAHEQAEDARSDAEAASAALQALQARIQGLDRDAHAEAVQAVFRVMPSQDPTSRMLAEKYVEAAFKTLEL
jgi:hypothetical protein